jgi:hypothetical protein
MPITRSAPLTAAKAGGRAARAFRVAAAIAAALGPAWPTGVGAQELSFLAGPLGGEHEDTYSWEAGFRQGLGRYAAWSFSWLNEGHIPDHHRDGPLLQAWARRIFRRSADLVRRRGTLRRDHPERRSDR